VGLQQECDVLRTILNEICETAEGLKTRSALLPDCSLYDLPNQVEYIFDDCFHGLELFKKASAQVELIQAMLGVQSGIATMVPIIANQAAHASLVSLNQGKLEALEDLSWFEAGAENLVQIIRTAIQTGKSTQATVMLVTSMCGMAVDLANQTILAPGMPLSQSSLVQDIEGISKENDKFLGFDGNVLDAYRKKEEIEEINERLKRD
jgi:hypothetical protein